MIRILFATALLAISCQAAAAGLPPKVEIKYKVSMGSVKIGEGTDVFEHDGKTYKVVSESKTAGLAALIYRLDMRREATGTITSKGLRPDDYRETRNGQPRRSAHFDWQKKQADLQDGERKQTVPLPENTWDNTSFGYNFAFGKPEAGDMDLYLTDGRRVIGLVAGFVDHYKRPGGWFKVGSHLFQDRLQNGIEIKSRSQRLRDVMKDLQLV